MVHTFSWWTIGLLYASKIIKRRLWSKSLLLYCKFEMSIYFPLVWHCIYIYIVSYTPICIYYPSKLVSFSSIFNAWPHHHYASSQLLCCTSSECQAVDIKFETWSNQSLLFYSVNLLWVMDSVESKNGRCFQEHSVCSCSDCSLIGVQQKPSFIRN